MYVMEGVCVRWSMYVCARRESRKELVPRTIGPGSHSSSGGQLVSTLGRVHVVALSEGHLGAAFSF